MFQLLLGVSMSFQARWDIQSLSWSLNLRQGLFSVIHARRPPHRSVREASLSFDRSTSASTAGSFLTQRLFAVLPTDFWQLHQTACPSYVPFFPSLMNKTQVTSKSLAWGNNSPPTWRETSTISGRWCPQQTWRLSGVMPHANQEDVFAVLKQHCMFFLP